MTQHRILFVCLGNICRSPMAEGLFRQRVSDAGLADAFEIDSVGTGAWHVDAAPDRRAQATMRARGIDISGLRGRQLTEADLRDFDLVLAMDRSNLAHIQSLAPTGLEAKARLLLDFAPETGHTDVPDPYYGGDDGFAEVLALLEKACDGLLAALGETGAVNSSPGDKSPR